MTPNDFDDFDKDLDDASFDGEEMSTGNAEGKPEKASLREAWDNNPMLKLGAVVIGIGLSYGAYAAFFSSDEVAENRSVVRAGNIGETKVIPGKEGFDKVYRDAVQESNQKIAEKAQQTGESAIPVPIATTKSEDLDIPEAKLSGNDDPLAEWRQRVEQKRKVDVQETIPQEPPMQPEIVPMVQPQPVRQVPVIKVDPQAAKILSVQMRAILAGQAPAEAKRVQITTVDSLFEARKKEAAANAAAPASGATLGGNPLLNNVSATDLTQQKADVRTIVPAGNIVYAQLTNELNSDVPGPALAQIMSGPMAGAKAIGEFAVEGEYLVIKFSRLVKDDVVYAVNGIALDENTTLSGQQSDIDRHYFTRILIPAAAEFVKGYASAIAERGTETTVTAGGGAVQSTPDASPKEALYEGLEKAGDTASAVLKRDATRPITVKVFKGTTMGILFMDSVTTESAQK